MTYYRIEPAHWINQAKHRARNVQRGLCICCSAPVWRGRRRCLRCLKVQRACERKRRQAVPAPQARKERA